MKESTLTTRKAAKPRRNPTKGFDYRDVPIEDRIALQGHEAEFNSVARKTIAETFSHAERLIDAKQRLPKRYGEWVKKACKGISIRSAGNYTAAYERFHDRVDEIVALDILPTHLYAMARATDPAIEEIFGRAEAGETVTGADITRIIKLHKDPSDMKAHPKADQPMKKGLLAFIKAPTDEALNEWFQRLEEFHGKLVEALPDGLTKTRLLKGELTAAVADRAGWLRSELIRLTSLDPYRSTNPSSAAYYPSSKPCWPSGHWRNVETALRGVSGVGRMNFKELEDALRLQMIPPIEWALGRASSDLFENRDDQFSEEGKEAGDGIAERHDDASASSTAA